MDIKDYTQVPVFFNRNRVKRVYVGGKLFSEFLGDDPVDGHYPEEWVASCVPALNKDNSKAGEGLSFIENTNISFNELITLYPQETLGHSKDFGILVKYLDSAIRLPIQAHPDPEFSKKFFNSEYGKTEMWLVLATRPDACIYFGFKEKITPEQFEEYINLSESDKSVFEQILNKVYVKPGDVFLIPAKAVHAIGYGCCILEVQEPTDFTIQPEHWCGDYKLNQYEMYLNLDTHDALKCFDYSLFGENVLNTARKSPVIISNRNGIKKESLVSYNDTPCFNVNRYTLSNCDTLLPASPALYIITKGSGFIDAINYFKEIKMGDYFFLPAAAQGKYTVHTDIQLEFIECLGPNNLNLCNA